MCCHSSSRLAPRTDTTSSIIQYLGSLLDPVNKVHAVLKLKVGQEPRGIRTESSQRVGLPSKHQHWERSGESERLYLIEKNVCSPVIGTSNKERGIWLVKSSPILYTPDPVIPYRQRSGTFCSFTFCHMPPVGRLLLLPITSCGPSS